MTSLPYAAEQISAFLVDVGLAKTKPNISNLLNPTFVNNAKE